MYYVCVDWRRWIEKEEKGRRAWGKARQEREWERGRGEGRERGKLEKYTCDSEESPESPETREVVSTSVSSGGISSSIS